MTARSSPTPGATSSHISPPPLFVFESVTGVKVPCSCADPSQVLTTLPYFPCGTASSAKAMNLQAGSVRPGVPYVVCRPTSAVPLSLPPSLRISALPCLGRFCLAQFHRGLDVVRFPPLSGRCRLPLLILAFHPTFPPLCRRGVTTMW